MSSPKYHQFMMNLHKCYTVVLQNTAKGGITAADIAKEMHVHKSVVHHLLNTLKALKKVRDQHGMWFIRPKERTVKQQEKEIVIELPIPKNDWQRMVILEGLAKDWEETFGEKDNLYRISLEKLKETRTITIKGKNVDDFDLQKWEELTKETYKQTSFSLRGLFKNLKKAIQQPKSSKT